MQVHHAAKAVLARRSCTSKFSVFPWFWRSFLQSGNLKSSFLLIFCLFFFFLKKKAKPLPKFLTPISACSQYHRIATYSPLTGKSGSQSCPALLWKMKFHLKSFRQLLCLTGLLPLWRREQKKEQILKKLIKCKTDMCHTKVNHWLGVKLI